VSKSKKPRKRYVPREQRADPVTWALAGVHKIPTESIDASFAPINAAFGLLKQGKAAREDWNVISQALNVAEALAGLQIGSNLIPEIVAGQRWLHQIALRMLERDISTCYAAELAAIDEALTMYRAQMQVCTQAEFGRAVARVKDLHRSGAMDDVARLYQEMDQKEAACDARGR
jgi:hypothetical protein